LSLMTDPCLLSLSFLQRSLARFRPYRTGAGKPEPDRLGCGRCWADMMARRAASCKAMRGMPSNHLVRCRYLEFGPDMTRSIVLPASLIDSLSLPFAVTHGALE